MNCPKCKFQITKEYINIMTDVAQCQHCDYIFKISEVLSNEIDDGFNINIPPGGAWIRTELNYIVIGATTRSPIAFFLVPFMIVWSGGSIGSIYGSQIVNGKFDPEMALFGIPFLIGSIIFWSIAAMAIWGKVEITIDNNGGKVFTGLQNIGLTKKFTWEDISTIKENQSTYIPQGQKHRLFNPGAEPLEIIEVQSGSYLGEDDIVRFDDIYGRE